jgi:hypothetical protein
MYKEATFGTRNEEGRATPTSPFSCPYRLRLLAGLRFDSLPCLECLVAFWVLNQYLFDDEVERHFSTVHFLIGAL